MVVLALDGARRLALLEIENRWPRRLVQVLNSDYYVSRGQVEKESRVVERGEIS